MPLRLGLPFPAPRIFPSLAALTLALACAGSRQADSPRIAGFRASATEVDVGEKVDLTATYANGQGKVDPAPGPVASGRTITVDPLQAATFTLTVTSPRGAQATAQVAVHVKPGLLVDVSGLPPGLHAAVTVDGPGGFHRALDATTPLRGLPPGVYTVRAPDVSGGPGGALLHPLRPVQAITLAGTGLRARVLYPGPTLTVALPGSVPMAFTLIPAGTFTMGAAGPGGAPRDAQPPHAVTFPRAFYLATRLTTQAQWQTVAGSLPPMPDPPYWRFDPDMPVSTVSWYDIHDAFLPRLADQMPGYAFRLPSEAEWEYCVRAGTSTTYPWGDAFDGADAFITYLHPGDDPGQPPPGPGAKPANPWGLFDMQGLLMQWVEDGYNPGYEGAPEDGLPRPSGPGIFDRCVRGTAFNTAYSSNPNPDFDHWRSDYRFAKGPGNRHSDFGFRLALDIQD